MARINSFRDLEVWPLAMDLVLECYQLTRRLPAEERFGLIAQARRCAVSIPSNIAEGHNRHARSVFLQHVNIALGSAAELDTQIQIGVRLGYLPGADACRRIHPEALARWSDVAEASTESLVGIATEVVSVVSVPHPRTPNAETRTPI